MKYFLAQIVPARFRLSLAITTALVFFPTLAAATVIPLTIGNPTYTYNANTNLADQNAVSTGFGLFFVTGNPAEYAVLLGGLSATLTYNFTEAGFSAIEITQRTGIIAGDGSVIGKYSFDGGAFQNFFSEGHGTDHYRTTSVNTPSASGHTLIVAYTLTSGFLGGQQSWYLDRSGTGALGVGDSGSYPFVVHGVTAAVPEPGALGLLCCGALGALAWRRSGHARRDVCR